MPSTRLRVEGQPVEHRLGSVGGAGRVEVLGVGAQNLVDAGKHGIGRRVQCPVLGRGVQRGKGAGRDPRPAGSVVHLLPQLDVLFGFPGRFAPALRGACTLIRPAYRAIPAAAPSGLL